MTPFKYFRLFLAGGGILLLSVGCGESKSEEPAKTDVQAVKVETGRLSPHQFRRVIQVQGVIQPVNSATIAARVGGTIDSLKAEEGSIVKQGDILFQTDRSNLENQVVIAEKDLKVAEDTLEMVKMDVGIAQTNLDKAELDHKRAQTLRNNNAISQDAFEQAETVWKNAQAYLRKAEAVAHYTGTKVEQAKASLEIAHKNLGDSIIRAPYDGVITEKYLDAEEFAAAGARVLEIEDQSKLEVSARISSLYYEALNPTTQIVLAFGGQELCRTHLSYLSPSVDPLSRTFEIKAELPPQKNLVSGTLCDIAIIIAERNGVGLPDNAMLPRAQGRYAVFAVKDGGKAEELFVTPGFSTDGYTEILNPEVLDRREIIVSGQYFLNDGSSIRIVNPEKP